MTSAKHANLPSVESADASRVRAVAETLRDLGMQVSALIVGDVRIQLATPWGAQVQSRPEASPATAVDEGQAKLEAARKQARAEFGRVLPDDTVKRIYAVP